VGIKETKGEISEKRKVEGKRRIERGKQRRRATEAKWRAIPHPTLREREARNAVPRILSWRLHLYLSPIRLYGIYPSVFPAGFRATCAGKGRMRAMRERAPGWSREGGKQLGWRKRMGVDGDG